MELLDRVYCHLAVEGMRNKSTGGMLLTCAGGTERLWQAAFEQTACRAVRADLTTDGAFHSTCASATTKGYGRLTAVALVLCRF